ncbi:hypothetical protein K439DRAFT_1610401 [Ramaria rubella]|nr:hypothetical protein K439DRAFT_1610401 [Ramaria rubella]
MWKGMGVTINEYQVMVLALQKSKYNKEWISEGQKCQNQNNQDLYIKVQQWVLQARTSPKLQSFKGTGLPPLLPSAPQPPLPPVISGYFACSCPLHASKHSLNLLGIIRHCSPLSFLWLQSPASAFINSLFLPNFSVSQMNPSTPECDHQEECAREHEQHQMTSTTNHWECAAAATADRILHQQPPPPHPFPHLALQQPQRHSGDPFVQPPNAGSSHIPNPQPLNPSPRDQVADIHAQLAAIQQQQPLPAR